MKIEFFKASFVTLIYRFYFLLFWVTAGLFLHQTWMYIVGYGIVISCMLGMKITFKTSKREDQKFVAFSKPQSKLKQISRKRKAG